MDPKIDLLGSFMQCATVWDKGESVSISRPAPLRWFPLQVDLAATGIRMDYMWQLPDHAQSITSITRQLARHFHSIDSSATATGAALALGFF